jgi:hypothetical protein
MRTVLTERAKARAPALCVVCNSKPRAGNGLLTRCLSCIRAAAEADRQARERRMAAFTARMLAPAVVQKTCRTCDKAKALELFSKHRLSRDGHRHDCKACVKAERTKWRELTASEHAVEQARRAQPHRRASNRRAVASWTKRNPDATRARRKLQDAVRRGEIVPAGVCQAKACTSNHRIEGHHANYRRWNVMAWLCARHHRRAHTTGDAVRLKRGAPWRFARVPKMN